MAKLTKEQIIESLKEMSLLEVNDLVKAIETEFGVSAAAPVAAAAGPASGPAEAPTSVTVTLTDAGAQKVAIIKLFREITGLGLIEAKTAVEKTPAVVKENIKPEEAEEIKKKFEAAGAKVKVEA
ncbi:MAG: 50S ribosomal protein L7/L12 [Mycoplasmataceae bacterium]|jgi:large subunit ribosomal protein L7/L12|nr:50S ribosomal protein L7/L12 [Mycoplasmataceae bacterium]